MTRVADLPPVLLGLVVLVLAQLAGLSLAALLDLPVPGVVLGLVLLLVLGLLRPTAVVARLAEPGGALLLKHLQLLFVPPGVGVIVELQTIAEEAPAIALAVGGSFVLALIAVGHVLQALLRWGDRRRAAAGGASPTGGGPVPSAEPGTEGA